MTFPSKNYTTFTTSNWQEWAEALKYDYEFCRNMTDIFDFEGKCKAVDLPSWHPYWTHVVNLERDKIGIQMIETLNDYIAAWGGTATYKANLRYQIENLHKFLVHRKWYMQNPPTIEPLTIDLYS